VLLLPLCAFLRGVLVGSVEATRRVGATGVLLAREQDDPALIANALVNYAATLLERGRHADAVTYFEESLVLRRQLGDPRATARRRRRIQVTYRGQPLYTFYLGRSMARAGLLSLVGVRLQPDPRAYEWPGPARLRAWSQARIPGAPRGSGWSSTCPRH
jgi:hypothetical protein